MFATCDVYFGMHHPVSLFLAWIWLTERHSRDTRQDGVVGRSIIRVLKIWDYRRYTATYKSICVEPFHWHMQNRVQVQFVEQRPPSVRGIDHQA